MIVESIMYLKERKIITCFVFKGSYIPKSTTMLMT